MELKSEFEEFLTEIRPTEHQRKDLQTGHKVLRDRLGGDEKLAKIIVGDFLQGSYRRHTAVRPKGDKRADVDIIVVTRLHEAEFTPEQAMAQFQPFLEKHYKNKWRFQGRSIGIELSYVDLDLVITAAPSEAEIGILKSEAVRSDADLEEAPDWRLNTAWLAPESRRLREDARELMKAALSQPEWKTKPLRIPDREAKKWDDTNPLEQMRWTATKNGSTSGHYVNVVKALKWWRLEKYPEQSRPKGYPLERMIGDCCPDRLGSVAEGVVETLEAMVKKYEGGKPRLPDHGVPDHDVLARITTEDFAAFYEHTRSAAPIARRAFNAGSRSEACDLWRELFGSKFPKRDGNGGGGGGGGGSKQDRFEEPDAPAIPGSGRFAAPGR
jgi:Second Messenger Oligonucleotide or Dinucleotide Synthetase domain